MKRVLSFSGLELDTSYEDNRKFKFLGCSNFETQIHTPGGACAQGWAHCFLQVQGITPYCGLYTAHSTRRLSKFNIFSQLKTPTV